MFTPHLDRCKDFLRLLPLVNLCGGDICGSDVSQLASGPAGGCVGPQRCLETWNVVLESQEPELQTLLENPNNRLEGKKKVPARNSAEEPSPRPGEPEPAGFFLETTATSARSWWEHLRPRWCSKHLVPHDLQSCSAGCFHHQGELKSPVTENQLVLFLVLDPVGSGFRKNPAEP